MNLVGALIDTLAAHQWESQPGRCRCGWKWTPETAQDPLGWERHQAAAIIDALAEVPE